MKIKRFMNFPKTSFMLLGPRGVGKSTYIENSIKFDFEISLLQSKFFIPLKSNPSLLSEWTKNLKKDSWIFIDEIQKIPALLDEVHFLYQKKGFNFALSGSSARKLKKSGVNLLAGRVLSEQLFPLTYNEYKNNYSINDCLEWGSLPKVITSPESREDYLATYVENYVRQELVEEGEIRKLEPFIRFLDICGKYHGQILNVENIARESSVSRSNIDNYFKILEDTLLGYRLEPLNKKWNSKEVTHPKFYLFDSGVARACASWIRDDVDSSWLGFSFESLVINEVRAYNKYLKRDRKIYYYKYNGGYEVDLIIENKKKTLSQSPEYLAIEIKNSKRWDKRFNEPLIKLQSDSRNKVTKLLGIYRGQEIIDTGDVLVLPAEEFLDRLAKGELFI